MLPPIGLYYPYTHFHDPGWLRIAALYWPRMARIAPLGYADVENPDARRLRDELDFVLDLDPGDRSRREAGLKALRAIGMHGGRIRDRYRIPERIVRTVGGASGASMERVEYRFPDLGATVRLEDPVRRWPRPVDFPVPASFGRLIGLHRDKVYRVLLMRLERNRLAVIDDSGEYAAVHPNFAWAYMCMLADEMAAERRLVPVSDDASAYANCGAWTPDRFASVLLGQELAEQPRERDQRASLAMLALRVAVPSGLEDVPIDRIIAIRKRHGAELDAFRELIAATSDELAEELGGITDPAVLQAYLEETAARRFERPLADLRRAMRALGVETTLGAASVKFELPAAAALAAGWAAGQPVVAGAGAAFGIAAWYRNWRHSRSELARSSPVGYLWRVERGTAGPDLLRRAVGFGRRTG
ncbi:MAG TPA: DUF6236 family protein [Glycomyces sp.]|nr:DUF6236 family protein [Glycomyces sp.]